MLIFFVTTIIFKKMSYGSGLGAVRNATTSTEIQSVYVSGLPRSFNDKDIGITRLLLLYFILYGQLVAF